MNPKSKDDIIKEVFWDYNMTADGVDEILKGSDDRKKKWLLCKFIANLSNPFDIFKFIPKDDFKKILSTIDEKEFKHHFQKNRLKILRNIYLKEKNIIPEAEWKDYTPYKIKS